MHVVIICSKVSTNVIVSKHVFRHVSLIEVYLCSERACQNSTKYTSLSTC
jgi:hypothetical protein